MPSSDEKKAYNREYYRKNSARLKEAAKTYYYENREHLDEKKRQWNANNRARVNEAARLWRLRNIETRRAAEAKNSRAQILKKHGLTEKEFATLLKLQNGVCAICEKTCDVRPTLSIDHDHATGAVRGLLCGRCNSGLGFFKDSIDILARATNYLRMWGN